MIPDDLLQLSFRWAHVLAGVLFVGLLYFFNWVHAGFASALDGETRRAVVSELMPRALFWLRWGAALTWLSGASLIMTLYYAGPYLLEQGTEPELMQWLPAFLGLFVGFLVYDILFRVLGRSATGHALAVVFWGVLAIGFGCWLETLGYSERALLIHIGALLGTVMAANVWLRIWPAERRILTAIRNGEAPRPADSALAGLRSKHNTYMSFPLLLLMISVDQAGLSGAGPWQGTVAGVFAIGWLGCWLVFQSVPNVRGL